MQDQPNAQLTQYVQQAYQAGASVEAIRAQLLVSGWREDMINPVLAQFQPAVAKPTDPHRVSKAIWWIIGPFVALLLVAAVQLLVRFVTSSTSSMGVIGIFRIAINLLTVLVGIVAVPMMITGPIPGIVKLVKK